MAFLDFLKTVNPFRSKAATPPRGSWRTPLEMTSAPQAEAAVQPIPGLEDAYFPKETPTDALDAFLYFREPLPVTSSNVSTLEYDGETSQLFIRFNNGNYYEYEGVSIQEAKSIATAASKGKWVWRNLRRLGTVFGFNPAHPYTFLSGPSQKMPQWFRNAQTRSLHGSVGPEGATKKQLAILMPKKWMG